MFAYIMCACVLLHFKCPQYRLIFIPHFLYHEEIPILNFLSNTLQAKILNNFPCDHVTSCLRIYYVFAIHMASLTVYGGWHS